MAECLLTRVWCKLELRTTRCGRRYHRMVWVTVRCWLDDVMVVHREFCAPQAGKLRCAIGMQFASVGFGVLRVKFIRFSITRLQVWEASCLATTVANRHREFRSILRKCPKKWRHNPIWTAEGQFARKALWPAWAAGSGTARNTRHQNAFSTVAADESKTLEGIPLSGEDEADDELVYRDLSRDSGVARCLTALLHSNITLPYLSVTQQINRFDIPGESRMRGIRKSIWTRKWRGAEEGSDQCKTEKETPSLVGKRWQQFEVIHHLEDGKGTSWHSVDFHVLRCDIPFDDTITCANSVVLSSATHVLFVL